MKHPKTKIVHRLRHMAQQATETATLRDQQAHEKHNAALTEAREAAPTIQVKLHEAADLLTERFTAEDFEEAMELIRQTERRHCGIRIPKPIEEHNGARGRAADLNRIADLIEDAEGDTVTTSELEKFGLVAYLRV